MANAPNTQSTLSLPGGINGGINKTSTALSTNIIIMVNNTPVGAVQSLSVQERRNIKTIDEIGTDGHIDSVPNQSATISGTCNRIRFDRLRIAEAFSRSFIHARSQVYPFDIYLFDQQKREEAFQIVTVIKNVWINSIETTYQATDFVIADTMGWTAETIFSSMGPGQSPNGYVAIGGERGISHTPPITMGINGSANNIEQQVDRGEGFRRGSLDAAGLIDIGEYGPF